MNVPIITKFTPPWSHGTAIKGSAEPFTTVAPIKLSASPEEVEKIARKNFKITDPIAPYMEADLAQIPLKADREFYYDELHANYWVSGLSDFLRIRQQCQRLAIDINQGRYFELGCASGRVLRHFAAHSAAEVYGCDINLRHIEWCRLFLPERVVAFHSMALPNLPLEDRYFDALAAFSVFTHIDDLEMAWLLELRRILKPGGLAYLTVSTEDTWNSYRQGWIKNHLMALQSQITEYEITEDFFDSPSLPSEKTVFWWSTPTEVYNSSVFHTKQYLHREWGRIFEVVDIIRNGHAYQDVVVLRKRPPLPRSGYGRAVRIARQWVKARIR